MSSSIGASGGDSGPSMAAKPLVVCSFISVPAKYHKAFAYLDGTQLFFLDRVRRMNRLGFRQRCTCFVTDYTINIAARRGQVTRCAKVEDVAELICDDKRHTLGVRMRSHPFAIDPDDGPRWNCFYEMPVDLVLYADSPAQYASLLHVLRFVYRTCTRETLPCRPLNHREIWQASLVVTPDGSRVKKRPMLYHPVAADVPENLANADDLPATSRDARNGTGSYRPPPILSAIESSPAAAVPADRMPFPAASPAPSAASQLPQRSARAASAPSSASDRHTALPALVAVGSDAPVASSSATRRRVNPLLDTSYTPDTPVAATHGSPSPSAASVRARPSTAGQGEVRGGWPRASLNGALTSSSAPAAATEQPSGSVLPKEPGLPRSRYSKEGELDDVKRYRDSFITDPYASRYTSAQWSPRSSPHLVLSPLKAPRATKTSTPPRLQTRPRSGSATIKLEEVTQE